MHPLTPDLSKLSNDDLYKKIGELQQKLTQSFRFGQAELSAQIQMVLEDYQNEAAARNQKVMQDLESKNKNFKNIIDIQ